MGTPDELRRDSGCDWRTGYLIYPLRELRAEIKQIFEELTDPDEVQDKWLDEIIYEFIYMRFFGPMAQYSSKSVYEQMTEVGIDDASTQINVEHFIMGLLGPITTPVYETYRQRAFIKFHLDPTKLVYEINLSHERTSPSHSFQAAS